MTDSSKNHFRSLRVSAFALCILGLFGILSSVGTTPVVLTWNPKE